MTKRLKCYISAPPTINTSVLRRVLEKLDVEAYDFYDFTVGEQIHNVLKKKIKQADFAIIVISDRNNNVFYEMGICEGMGKPLFVIVGKDNESPYFVQKYIYFKTDLEFGKEDLLEIPLSRFVQDLRSKKTKTKRIPKESKSSSLSQNLATHYLERIENLRTADNPREVEQLVQDLLSTLNLQSQPNQFGGGDQGVDFAIWDDSLALSIGNPLFIEVKYGALTLDQIRQAENQLGGYIAKTDVTAAVLLYLDKKGRRFRENYSLDRKSTRLNSSHMPKSRMPSSA